ncbi:restriction endonuclease [Poseidonibacter antarcticus]|uniref:restriction endonuclease n=1 Tax=Poseidonibacter antarcticus TaxID=2478538 RepID=UPI000EF4FAFD|nr:restriction endonuclease [Poseidonibacter antarcticus]
MKLGQKLAILTIAASVSLFANGITNVTSLVDQINKTSDIKAKQVLMKKLDIEIASIDQKDLAKAKEIIDTNLKK